MHDAMTSSGQPATADRPTTPGRPAMRYRGSVEGFYGTPWSHADRLRHLDYLGAHRMNMYLYAPKDDPYHRELWRVPYPPEQLAQLGELVDRARANQVTFAFAVSPGLSMRYTEEADFDALIAKFAAIYAIGGRAFNLALDDIDHTVWHCAADEFRFTRRAQPEPGFGGDEHASSSTVRAQPESAFGGDEHALGSLADDPGACAAQAQAYLLNRLQKWVVEKGDVAPLQMVPTEYHGVEDTSYKQVLREQLDPEVLVMWTGMGVVPPTITCEQAARARAVFGHEILIWDNYPVNDYIAGRVPLGDYRGRESGLSAVVTGVLANPMNQAAMSEVALYSVAEYTWDDTGYDARRSWQAALSERAGADPAVRDALRVFADVCTLDERLHLAQAPEHAAAVATFWADWRAGRRDAAVAGLRPVAARLAAAPAVIRAGVVDGRFVAEGAAWLDATELYGRAMVAAAEMLAALATGDDTAGGGFRRRVDELVDQAGRCRDHTEPHRTAPARVGDGVLDRFLAEAVRMYDGGR